MKTWSRIKFNPATREIEIEGSEQFVKAYFRKLQAMMSGTKAAVGKAWVRGRPAGKSRRSKKAPEPGEKKAAKRSARTGNMETLLPLIRESSGGISTADLKKKTGLTDRQIWAVVYRAEKRGMIGKVSRGLYAAV